MVNPRHHQNIRKRERRNKKSRFIYWFDKIIIIAGIFTVIATIPQVLEIWVNKNAIGVSTISWGYYVFYAALFTIYGFIHNEFPIIFNYSIATILYTMVLVGSVVY